MTKNSSGSLAWAEAMRAVSLYITVANSAHPFDLVARNPGGLFLSYGQPQHNQKHLARSPARKGLVIMLTYPAFNQDKIGGHSGGTVLTQLPQP
jgi:hypothetical protein